MSAIKWAYNQFVEQHFPLPSEHAVAALEERIGRSLPEHYRNFLLEFNGGLFNEPEIRFHPDGESVDRLTFMYGIGAPEKYLELATEDKLAIWDDNIPPQIIPIGTTMKGCFIMIITHEDDYGTVFFRSPTQSFFLGDDIENFFALLKSPPEA